MGSPETTRTVLRLVECPDSVTLHLEGPLTGASYHATAKALEPYRIGARPPGSICRV